MDRYWITPWGTLYRKWTEEENRTMLPQQHLFEEVFVLRCGCCGSIMDIVDKDSDSNYVCSECKLFNKKPTMKSVVKQTLEFKYVERSYNERYQSYSMHVY